MTLLAPSPLVEMDGRFLYYAFMAGGKKVIQHQVDLNMINVFPVNDGDTGTNLASTIRSVMESLHPHRSYKITADRIAQATLINARGNSGIIFAQFFYGLSAETGEFRSVNLGQFAEAIKRSVSHVYEAVSRPVEGTMLTVIKDFANYIYESWNRFSDFNHLFLNSHEVLKKSLKETTSKLAILERNKVVDAGAKGFVLFMEGIIEFISKRNIKELILSKLSATPALKVTEAIPENISYRYCTEAVIKDCRSDRNSITEILHEFGDSVVVAGSDKIRRFHVHTNSPAALFEKIRDAGTITFQKADDMIRHIQTVNNRKWNIALVTDSTCDLSQELLDYYQVNMVPISISFGDNNYLDKVTIQPEQFYTLLDKSKDFPKTAQVNEQTFLNLFSHLASYYDSVIAVHLSDAMSGTCNNSQRAAQKISREFGKPVTVINSKNLSGTLGLLVLRAARAIEAGLSHDEVVRLTEKAVSNSRILVTVRTLKYMVKGGRVTATKGLIAKLLNINPIVSLDDSGKAFAFDKAFTQKSSMKKVIRRITRDSTNRPIWNYIVLHADNQKAADWYSNRMEKLTGKKPVSVVNISPVIGANAGLGAASVALLYE
ncbi:MAG: DegV family protein [Bacteroidota bacterium]|nr:DegV family protein [Bacteroidota bacterium]